MKLDRRGRKMLLNNKTNYCENSCAEMVYIGVSLLLCFFIPQDAVILKFIASLLIRLKLICTFHFRIILIKKNYWQKPDGGEMYCDCLKSIL